MQGVYICFESFWEVRDCPIGTFELSFEGLLIDPWQECKAAPLANSSTPPHHFNVIDALDDINGDGGSEFCTERKVSSSLLPVNSMLS